MQRTLTIFAVLAAVLAVLVIYSLRRESRADGPAQTVRTGLESGFGDEYEYGQGEGEELSTVERRLKELEGGRSDADLGPAFTSADKAFPLTVEFSRYYEAGRADATTYLFSRSKKRIYFSPLPAEEEWVLHRRISDPKQAVGNLVRHSERLILKLTYQDLEDEGIGGDWERLTLLGITAAELGGLTDTGETKEAFGLEFRQLAAEPETSGLIEVWWNDEHSLPLLVVRDVEGGRWVQEVLTLQLAADPELLWSPMRKHTDYGVLELSEWRAENEQLMQEEGR